VLAATCAVLGGLVGVLTAGPAYRLAVPAGAPPLDHCARCASALPDRLWVPPRCRACRYPLGPRRWLTGLVGAVCFAALGWALGPDPMLPAALLVAGIGGLLAAIDLACHRLPDPLVAAALVTIAASGAAVSLVDGSGHRLVRSGLAGLLLAGGYLVLALLPGAPLGFGDVKLAGVLGLLLGWLGWPAVLLGAVLPILLNGPVAIVLLLRGRAHRDTELPLGPALLAGALLATLAHPALG
jgi:leader peptidase (prepilin peptidase)/N-methyltransferase